MSKKKQAGDAGLEAITLLKNVPLFRELMDEELELVARSSAFVTYADDQPVFCNGTSGESLYIVKSGIVRITAEKDGEQTDIARFIPGELFGEIDLFEDSPRDFDAIADGDTELLVFPAPGEKFEKLMEKHPALFARVLTKLLAQISVRIRETNKLVSEKAPWVEDLRHQLFFDKLTGLYNKTYLEDELKTELARRTATTALLGVKPDNFKPINDGFGHEAGDKALRLLAETVRQGVGKDGIVVRFRGDEFVAVLAQASREQSQATAQSLLSAVQAIDLTGVIGSRDIVLTASIGLCFFPDEAAQAADAVKLAVDRMFEARKEGGNRIR